MAEALCGAEERVVVDRRAEEHRLWAAAARRGERERGGDEHERAAQQERAERGERPSDDLCE